MKNYLYVYTFQIPLVYNSCDIRPRQEDMQLLLGLKEPIFWEKTIHIKESHPARQGEIYSAHEVLAFSIQNDMETELDRAVLKNGFILSVSNVVGHNVDDAFSKIDSDINKACMALSLTMGSVNCNKQGYQPRVYPVYSRTKTNRQPYLPYMGLYERETSGIIVDEQGNRRVELYVEAGLLEVQEGFSIKSEGFLDPQHFFHYYNVNMSSKAGYLIEEYYAALGTEGMLSKFFHLFSIVEFVEREYRKFLGEARLLGEKEVAAIMGTMETCVNLPKKEKDIVLSGVKQKLEGYSKTGREQSLVDILHAMKIDSVADGIHNFQIDAKRIKRYTRARNKLFHGNPIEDVQQLVSELMSLCFRILEYVIGEEKLSEFEEDEKE